MAARPAISAIHAAIRLQAALTPIREAALESRAHQKARFKRP